MTKTQQEKVIAMFMAAATKFIAKVDAGRALSVETYSELKACVEAVRKTYVAVDLDNPLITPLQTLVLRFFKTYGSLTDSELCTRFKNNFWDSNRKVTPSSLRTRRAELVAMGKLRNSLTTKPTPSGRKEIVWEVTPSWVLPARGPYVDKKREPKEGQSVLTFREDLAPKIFSDRSA